MLYYNRNKHNYTTNRYYNYIRERGEERERERTERERESNVPKWTVQILSNIHSVKVSSVDKTEHVWSFTTKVRTAGLCIFLSSLFVGLL